MTRTKRLPLSFFNRPTVEVARALVGCYLVQRRRGVVTRHMITETEAYDGFLDKASHAHRGLTLRNEIMFRRFGHIYVYFTYGVHWMLNLVTGPRGYPAAVLIRGIEDANGPGRLTKALEITGELNGRVIGASSGLWVEARKPAPHHAPTYRIKTSARIGVDYAGPHWSKRHYRFTLMSRASRATT